jgi:hypothetical protein
LMFENLSLSLIDGSSTSQRLALDGRTDAEVRAWMGPLMSAKGLDPCGLDAPAIYEMPAHPIAEGARYVDDGDELLGLADWYSFANRAIAATAAQLATRNLTVPAVRCWPHHFDLDSLVYFPARTSGDIRTMGIGFSPGDEYYDEPYYYVSTYPARAVASLPRLPTIGHWHSHHFTAAVATATEILSGGDPMEATGAYLKAATDIIIEAQGITSDIAR